jgi:hypothetical protein
VDLYIHYPIRLHGVVLNKLSPGRTLLFTYLHCFTRLPAIPPLLLGMLLLTRQADRHSLYVHSGMRRVMIRSAIHIYTLLQVHKTPDTRGEGLHHGAGLLQ